MKFSIVTLFVITLAFTVSCKSSKTSVSASQIEALDALVNSKTFYIESDWAFPQITNAFSQILASQLLPPGDNSGAISLIGNSNFLNVKVDSVTSYLPYFGQRQLQVAYGGTDTGINLEGKLRNYKVKTHKDHSKTISFSANNRSEDTDVFIRIFPNLKVDISIYSPSRRAIRYSGTVVKAPQSQISQN